MNKKNEAISFLDLLKSKRPVVSDDLLIKIFNKLIDQNFKGYKTIYLRFNLVDESIMKELNISKEEYDNFCLRPTVKKLSQLYSDKNWQIKTFDDGDDDLRDIGYQFIPHIPTNLTNWSSE